MRHVGRVVIGLAALAALLWVVMPAQPNVVHSQATFIVNDTADVGDNDTGDGVCNTGFDTCTLRAAIEQANATPELDTIQFNIPTSDPGYDSQTGTFSIAPDSALPTISQPVIIDGTSQPGFTGSPIIELTGSNAGSGVNGLTIDAGGSTVKGLVINRFLGHGIALRASGGNVIAGNFIGTDVTGTITDPDLFSQGDEYGNLQAGVYINNVSGNTIGGSNIDDDLDGFFNEDPVDGADNDGDTAVDEDALDVSTEAGNLISGSGRGISGGNGHGVWIFGSGATGNVVQGNFIGTEISGTDDRNNRDNGVFIDNAPGNTIGGTTAAVRNVISGNKSDGVEISGSAAAGNLVWGNFIGVNVTSTNDVGNMDGVFINGAPSNTIGGTASGAGNVISGNKSSGVEIKGSDATGNLVQGNLIGTDVNGTAAMGNLQNGVLISRAPGNTIGGTTAAARNIISGNSRRGVRIQNSEATGNLVQGNYIGTDVTGGSALANGNTILTGAGVSISSAPGNTIGGTTAGAGNVISANIDFGVEILNVGASGNLVQGNFIGTDASGTVALPNAKNGVLIDDAPNNTIGGTEAGAGNVISGNGSPYLSAGIRIFDNDASGNVVQGNLIGTDVNGTADLGNAGDGVFIDSAPSNTVGGTTAAARNIISGNNGRGVQVAGSGATGNVVQGNYIGTDVNGTADLGNTGDGVFISDAPTNTVGGTDAGARNIISGNDSVGVQIFNSSATGNVVQGNYIGTDVTGSVALGNSLDGVFINGAPSNSIGGTASGAGNVISANFVGVEISGVFATDNVVEGNYIGTDVSGSADLGNTFDGVRIAGTASNNTIGGAASSAGNIIAHNGDNGVRVDGGVGNAIHRNSIFSNAALGIDLANDGVTANDAGDGDTGPNNLQNYPVLDSVITAAGSTSIAGTLSSAPATSYRLEFFSNPSCDGSGYGEGQTLIGTATVTTDSSGSASIDVALTVGVSETSVITATATDPSGNTSEFSACRQVATGSDADGDGVANASDNCPTVSNPTQADYEGDGLGDACDRVDDVPVGHWALPYIVALYDEGITTGCVYSPPLELYCPTAPVKRDEMAVFIIRAMDETPVSPTGTVFDDVPASQWAAGFIERLAEVGVTSGCSASPPLYCPGSSVSRFEMAAFLLRGIGHADHLPPYMGYFDDVPAGQWYTGYVEHLFEHNITTGCSISPPLYCGADSVSRAEMAAFIARAWNLPLPP